MAYVYSQPTLHTVLQAMSVPYITPPSLSRPQSWNRTGNLIIRPLRVIVGALVFTTPGGAVDGDDVDDVNNDVDGVVAFDDDDESMTHHPRSAANKQEGPLWF